MNTDMTWQIECADVSRTIAVAESIGRQLRGQEVIELVSDLGGGKTTFVKGLAKGAGSKDLVSSPTFTLSNTYQADQLTLYHLDFYRLNEPGIMRDELAEIIADPLAVAIIEWAAIVEDVLPVEHITIMITATGETSRRLNFTIPSEQRYIIGDLL